MRKGNGRFFTVTSASGNRIASGPAYGAQAVIGALEEYEGERIKVSGLSHDERVQIARKFGKNCHCLACQY